MNTREQLVDPKSAELIKPMLGITAPLAGECLMSLMARTAAKNVLSRVRNMTRAIESDVLAPQFLPFTRRISVDQLSLLLGADPRLIEGMMHPAVDETRPLDKVVWYGTVIPRRFISVDRRFSPASLAKSAYVRAIWQVRPITFCPESMEFLVTKCPRCGTEVGWRLRCGFHVCENCGSSLRRGRPGKVEWSMRHHARAVAGLVSPFPQVRSAALHSLPEVFRNWEPGDAFMGAVELGIAFSFPDRKQHKMMSQQCGGGDFTKFDVGHLVAGYRAMLDWPYSLHSYLPMVICEGKRDLHNRLGPFGKYFLSSKTSGKAIDDLIRDEVKKTLTNNDLIPFGDNVHRAAWMKRSDRLTRNESGERFNIEPRVVGKLAKDGNASIRVGLKKGQVLYDPEKLGPSVEIYKSGLSSRVSGTRIGIPAFCMAALALRGLVEAVTDHDALIMSGEPLYDERSVTSLCDLLRGLARSSDGGRSFTVCMERHFQPEAWIDAICAILNGGFAVSSVTGAGNAPIDGIGLNEIEFGAFALALRKRKVPSDIIVPSVLGGSLLGIPGDVVASLVKLKLIAGEFRGRVGQISLAALADFSDRYVFGRESARLIGRGADSRRMEALGLKPVAEIKRYRIWLRVEVNAILGKLPA
jgi:hypothetical protein